MERTHREKVFGEYDRECESCGSDSELHTHHIDGDHTNDHISNLIPLCNSCHTCVHNGKSKNELISELIRALSSSDADEMVISTEDYEGVPEKASPVVKETYPGKKYVYWQWREGDSIKSKYVAPANGRVIRDKSQFSLSDF